MIYYDFWHNKQFIKRHSFHILSHKKRPVDYFHRPSIMLKFEF